MPNVYVETDNFVFGGGYAVMSDREGFYNGTDIKFVPQRLSAQMPRWSRDSFRTFKTRSGADAAAKKFGGKVVRVSCSISV